MPHAMSKELFQTVSNKDYLGVSSDDENLKQVVVFLDLKKNDVSKATGQAKSSIRYDHRMSSELKTRLFEIANIINLAASYFNGDMKKTQLWFQTKNPLLGNISPRDMIRYGRYAKLQQFVLNALAGNIP